MTRNRKPRKAYRPQPVHLNAFTMAFGRVHKIGKDLVANQVAIVATALREFSAGQHCEHHWRSLADTANVAETLSGMGLGSGPDADDVIERAQSALAAVRMRRMAGGTWTLYPAEIEALSWLVALHGKQLAECDYGEFERALQRTHERVSQARAGNAPRGAIVVQGDIAGVPV